MEKILFVHYPKCSTCQRAARWLLEHGVGFESRDIVLDRPNAEELRAWIDLSGLPAGRFFNTSGLRYRALGLKDRVKVVSEDELLDILASDGMLIKRPVLVSSVGVLVGFKESEWDSFFQDL